MYKHGMSRGKSREYNIWHSMIQRCEYPRHASYKDYGAKGIEVCKEWRQSFSKPHPDWLKKEEDTNEQ